MIANKNKVLSNANPERRVLSRKDAFRNVVGSAVIFSLSATSVFAAPAVTTANVNFREGPGTSFKKMGTLREGSPVELLDCTESGSWCAIETNGKNGFVSGRYLQEIPLEEQPGWPRAFELGTDGAFVVLHEPQFSEWDELQTLDALVAAEFHAGKEAPPVFGVIGLRASTVRDDEQKTIILSDIEVSNVDFGSLGREQLVKLTSQLGKLLPSGTIEVREERIVAGLANFAKITDVEGVKADPPAIFYSNADARLVQTDGPAVYASINGADGLEFVLNTNWDIFRAEGALWLRDEKSWMTASGLDGDWNEVTKLPAALSSLPDDGNWEDARAAILPSAYKNGAPEVFVSDVPSELIVFDGAPVYEDVPGGDLEWASNTESDLFRLKTTGVWYYLVSGRWFSTTSPDGPWKFATPDLPRDFQYIPDDQPYYTVRASVPGTSEANEARLLAAIPVMANINVSEIEAPTITYNGDPEFENIEGTDLRYAVNTDAPVIEVKGQFFVVIDGIWFHSDSAEGPWEVARAVPEEIYDIPPSSPVHNTTYVYVYDEDDDGNLNVGYSAGYLSGFLAWGVLIYGSGWYYPPYWHHHPHYPIYYPRPISFGGSNYYNPSTGRFGRYGYAYGPYRGIHGRSTWNPVTGGYARGAKVYGPHGKGGFISAGNPRTGTRVVAAGGSNVYGSWGKATVRRGADYLNVNTRKSNSGRGGMKWDSSKGQGGLAYDRRGNVYAGRDGNAYRRTDGNWQKWDNGGWTPVAKPDRSKLGQAGTKLKNKPEGQVRNNIKAKPKVNRPVQRKQPTKRVQNRTSDRVNKPAIQQRQQRTVPRQVDRDMRNRGVSNQRSHSRQGTINRSGGNINRGTINRGGQARGNINRGGGARGGRRR